MDCKAKAEEFFETIVKSNKALIEKIPLNCSQGENGTLLYLTFVEDGISSSKLAQKLNVSLPRMASVLNSLESKGLVEKMIDSEDKRKTIVYITEIGKKLLLDKKEEAIANIRKILEKLDEEEINQYIRLTKKIGKIVDDMQD